MITNVYHNTQHVSIEEFLTLSKTTVGKGYQSNSDRNILVPSSLKRPKRNREKKENKSHQKFISHDHDTDKLK